MKKYNLAPGDFPDLQDFKDKLKEHDFSKFSGLKQKLIDEVENVLGTDFPRLMEALPRALDTYQQEIQQQPLVVPLMYENPMASPPEEENNPWGEDNVSGGNDDWALSQYVPQYEGQFNSLQVGGLVTGGAAKGIMSASKLPVASLRKIWDLSDVDKDGKLNLNEFVIAMFLIDMAKQGHEVPDKLDDAMLPPN